MKHDELDGGRTRIGNTPTCEDCGELLENCSCDESGDELDGCETCGCLPCSCDGVPCEQCGELECVCESPVEDAAQGALFASEPVAPAQPTPAPDPDLIGEKLIADGYVPNLFLLDLNSSLGGFNLIERYSGTVWGLPSRVFQFPVITHRGPDGLRRLALAHPLLAEHPLVMELRARGYDVLESTEDCPNRNWVTRDAQLGEWHHAVDLISKHYRDLLSTRQFTSDIAIYGAVAFRCEYPTNDALTRVAREMREVMAALESPQPSSLYPLAGMFAAPHASTSEGKKKPAWPVNQRIGHGQSSELRESLAWAFIMGIEAGWFINVGGFLQWSEHGRKEYARCVVVQPAADRSPVESESPAESLPIDGAEIVDAFTLEPAGPAESLQLSLFGGCCGTSTAVNFGGESCK